MGEVSLDTVAALRDRHVIYAFCPKCRRSVELNMQRLVAIYGASLTVRQLRERLTCMSCGSRPREIRIVYSLPAGTNTSGTT
jgi:hypothetical protein